MTDMRYSMLAQALSRAPRKSHGERILTGCITGVVRFLTEAVAAFPAGWMLMLAIGMLHAEWWPGLPTIGYWPAVLAVFLLRGVFSHIPPSKGDAD